MKKTLSAMIIGLVILVLTGCAPVQFFSDNNLSKKTGLKYYTVKPFLHVERDSQTNRIVKAAIVYLPDLANPQYMTMRDGLNSRKLNLKLTEGAINTFGYSSTGKFSESVDALAALISKSTDAVTDLKTITGPESVKAPSNTVELYEIVFGQEKTTLRKVEIGEN